MKAGAVVSLALLIMYVFVWRQVTSPPPDESKAIASVDQSQLEETARKLSTAEPVQVRADNAYDFLDPTTTSSLSDTDIDGALVTDSNGNFVPDKNALQFFNYLFVAQGEISQSQVISTIRTIISETLQNPARQQAFEFLQKFLNFRALAREYHQTSGQPDSPSESLALLNQFQQQAFGEELANSLFAEDNLIERLRLERIETIRSPNLSPAEKRLALQNIDQQLPANVRSSYKRSTQPTKVADQVHILRQQGENEKKVRQLRESTFGTAAATRLQELDQQRERWRERVTHYQQQHKEITENPTLSDQQRAENISHLRSGEFSQQELLRLVVNIQ